MVSMKFFKFCYALSLFLNSSFLWAAETYCPDPVTSSLRLGDIPKPWVINPFSENKPVVASDLRFIRANILVAGFGRGVVCTYRTGKNCYSIWWEVNVKVPARTDNLWRDTLGGFECTEEWDHCAFYPATKR
jgi:hypothetical protein